MMYWKKHYRTLFFILVTCHIGKTVQKQHKAQLLGLFTTSGCTQGNEFECTNALANQNAILEVHQRKEFWYKTLVCFKDIKNSSKNLMNTILPLTTDERDFFQLRCENKDGAFGNSIKQFVILTYL